MNPSEALLQIALTQVPHIGHVHAKALAENFGSASGVFHAPLALLESLEGIGSVRARAIRNFCNWRSCEAILRQVQDLGAETIFITDPRYPRELLRCYDPPTLLYYRGRMDLQHTRKISIVGTRHHTEYGKQQTETLIRKIAAACPSIISGMAYGIDGLAHRAALKAGLPTLGILAHGLHTIYPPEHLQLARDILAAGGGLLTEFPPGVKPDRFHFPIRNRIVAGLCQVLVVVETGKKGGSMITASLAHGYHGQVYAIPGRLSDPRSAGCNLLLRQQVASLLQDTEAFLEELGWATASASIRQSSLPFNLDPAETILLNLLETHAIMHIDSFYLLSGLPAGAAAAAILSLEMRNLIRPLPGKRYQRCI